LIAVGFAERRGTIFFISLAYLGALLATAALYIQGSFSLPVRLGTVPLPVPWFGALGAVLISLTGVFDHYADWNPGLALWHYARPLIGASLGIVSVLVFQAGILAVGSNVSTQGSPGKPSSLLYFVIAFAVGYREETFRQLMKRLVDVILSPGTTGAPASSTILSLMPPTGPSAGGTNVGMTGAGLSGTQGVKFGPTTAQFTIDSDNHVTAVTPPTTAPGPVTVTVQTTRGAVTGPPFTYD
jgi:hypothetical protein